MSIPTTGKIMLIDTSKCIACRACQIACQQWNSLTAEDTEFTGNYKNPPDMSGANLTVVKFSEDTTSSDLKWLFFVDRCRHCENPFCMGACPLGAINQNSAGMVWIDETLCDPFVCHTGPPEAPRPCQISCPYNIPRWRYVKDGVEEGNVMRKCTFCQDRFPDPTLEGDDDPPSAQAGARFNGEFNRSDKPACVLACSTGALSVGGAERMKKKAKRRKKYLKNHGHSDARIYSGKNISGGTHVVWVLTDHRADYQDGTIVF